METRASKRRKLIAKEENERRERERDRISDLPDVLLHQILSFFDVKLIAQTSILSKRFRDLWYSFPSLDFSVIQSKSPGKTVSPQRLHNLKAKALNFLPRVLSRRNHESNIQCFCLRGNTITLSCLSESIRSIVRSSVQELELDVVIAWNFDLPRLMFSNESLRILTLKPNNPNFYRQPINFRFPTSYVIGSSGLKFLQSLSLTRIQFMKCKSIDDLFSNSSVPRLKKLFFKNCEGIPLLNISCLVLEDLELDSMQLTGLGVFCNKLERLRVVKCFRNYGDENWVKIVAPQIRSFQWEYNAVTDSCSIDSFTSLNTGVISFLHEKLSVTKLRSAANLLCVLFSAKHTFVGSLVVELLSEVDDLIGSLPGSFSKLSTLEVHTGLNKSDIPGITCLLRSCISLKKLTISIDNIYKTSSSRWNKDLLDNSNTTEEQYWESQSASVRSLLHHLKAVHIKVRGNEIHDSAFQLVKFFLQHGLALTEIILTSTNTLSEPLLWSQKFGPQISGIQPASADVKILYT